MPRPGLSEEGLAGEASEAASGDVQALIGALTWTNPTAQPSWVDVVDLRRAVVAVEFLSDEHQPGTGRSTGRRLVRSWSGPWRSVRPRAARSCSSITTRGGWRGYGRDVRRGRGWTQPPYGSRQFRPSGTAGTAGSASRRRGSGTTGRPASPDAARLVTSVEKVENTEGIEEARAGRLRQDREAGGDAEVLGGGEPRRGDLRFHSMDCGLVRAMTPVPKPRAITSVAGAIPVR